MASMRELVAKYNEAAAKVGEKPVKKFRDKETAETRTRSMVARAASQSGKKPGRPRNTEPINWPVLDERHKVRANTLGEMFVDAMRNDGATMDQLAKIIVKHGGEAKGTPEERARALLRMLHTYNGFGIRQSGDRFKILGLRAA